MLVFSITKCYTIYLIRALINHQIADNEVKMRRQPKQVLVFPFIKQNADIKYCIFYRNDLKVWQGISGGVEKYENNLQTVIRESYEEAHITNHKRIIKLKSCCYISVVDVVGSFLWGRDTALVKENAYGIEVITENISISNEHTEYKWCDFEEAKILLHWDSNKTALWELNHRLILEIES